MPGSPTSASAGASTRERGVQRRQLLRAADEGRMAGDGRHRAAHSNRGAERLRVRTPVWRARHPGSIGAVTQTSPRGA